MPVLKNARHELFCQQIAKGKTADEAYALAGYSRDRHHGARLATNGHIRQRIDELLGRAAIRTEVTVESITNMLKEDRDLARECKQTSAAVAAAKSIGELHGLYVERKSVEHKFVRAEELVDDALANIAIGSGEGIAEAPTDPKELN